MTLLVLPNLGLCTDRRRGGSDIPKGSYDSLEPWHEVGNLKTLEGWSGLTASADGAVLSVPGQARFSYPSGNDWSDCFGLRLDVEIPKGRLFEGEIPLSTFPEGQERLQEIELNDKRAVLGSRKRL